MSSPTKNREANELFARAAAVRAEIGDPTSDMTIEQFESKKKEFDALTLRAQLLAEHTPDAEIARQGGDQAIADRLGVEAVTRVASPEEAGKQDYPASLRVKVDALRKNVARVFGGTANFCRVARGTMNRTPSSAEIQVLEQAKALTRTIIGTANDASGGEFLLPLEQEQSIFRIDNTMPGLLQRAKMYAMRGRTKRIPYLIQDNEEVTRPLSGIAAITIVGEASAKPAHEPAFGQRTLTAFKYAAISEVGDETLDDDFTGDLEPALIQSVGQEILNQINFDITINGAGTTAPVGALHTSANTALIKVTRASENRITFADAVDMYTRHTHGPNSFWMISRRAMGELFTFELSTGSGATFLANLASNPTGIPLLGYPIVVTDFLNALGSEGDFALVNPDHYAAALRRQLTVESSIHVKFVEDVTTWRFFARGGGIPIPTAPYAYRSVSSTNVNEHSPFVVLDNVYA
jgi:HK97 family phage major capsid protein